MHDFNDILSAVFPWGPVQDNFVFFREFFNLRISVVLSFKTYFKSNTSSYRSCLSKNSEKLINFFAILAFSFDFFQISYIALQWALSFVCKICKLNYYKEEKTKFKESKALRRLKTALDIQSYFYTFSVLMKFYITFARKFVLCRIFFICICSIIIIN